MKADAEGATSSDAADRHDRFEALDGLRGVFALAVVLVHMKVAWHFFHLPLIRHGHLAVDFFFVLSGFVVTHASRFRLVDMPAVGAFMWRRFARLWPLHVTILALLVLLESVKYAASGVGSVHVDVAPFAQGTKFDVGAIPGNFFLVHSLGLFETTTWNGPSWSISAEFWAYLVFALAAVLLRRSTRTFAMVVSGASLLFLLTHVETINTTYDYGFARCLYGFALGHLVYLFHMDMRLQVNWAHWEVPCVVGTLLFITFAGGNRWSLLAPVLFTVAIFVFAQERGPISAALRTRPFAALGRWSYGIYMTHDLVLILVGRVVRFMGRRLGVDTERGVTDGIYGALTLIDLGNVWVMDALTVAIVWCVIGCGYLAYRFVERPAQLYLHSAVARLARKAVSVS